MFRIDLGPGFALACLGAQAQCASAPAAGTVLEVQRGDTFFDIAARFVDAACMWSKICAPPVLEALMLLLGLRRTRSHLKSET